MWMDHFGVFGHGRFWGYLALWRTICAMEIHVNDDTITVGLWNKVLELRSAVCRIYERQNNVNVGKKPV